MPTMPRQPLSVNDSYDCFHRSINNQQTVQNIPISQTFQNTNVPDSLHLLVTPTRTEHCMENTTAAMEALTFNETLT